MKKQRLLALIFGGALVLAGGLWIALRNGPTSEVKVQDSAEPPRPSPIDDVLPRLPMQVVDERNSVRTRVSTSAKAVEAKAAESNQDLPGTNWAVVAAIYKQYEAAEQRARNVNGFHATVFPSRGEGSKYMVLLGSGLTYASARALRDQATAAGLPPDTYVTKLSATEKK